MSKKLLKLAEKAFSQHDYESAYLLYCTSVSGKSGKGRSPQTATPEELLGIELCVLARVQPHAAQMIFDIYRALRFGHSDESAESCALNLIESIQAELYDHPEPLQQHNGIDYNEFKELVEGGGFEAIYENIVWSTNVFISQKKDWVDFVSRLIDNGYTELAYRYIEAASESWNSEARELLAKIKDKESGALRGKN